MTAGHERLSDEEIVRHDRMRREMNEAEEMRDCLESWYGVLYITMISANNGCMCEREGDSDRSL